MMKKYSLIVSAKARLKEIEQFYELQKYFPDACDDIFISHERKDAKKYASYASKSSDYIAVVGGDGLMHDAIGGVDENTPILYIPAGTCNDMGYNVNYNGELATYIKESLSYEPLIHDIYRFNSEYFTYLAAGGYLMHIPYSIKEEEKEKYGINAYMRAFAKELGNYQKVYSVDFQLDHVHFKRNCIAVLLSNSNYLANVPIYPFKELNDQKLRVMIVKPAPKWLILAELHELVSGNISLDELKFVEYHIATNIDIHFEKPLDHPFCLDGDSSGEKARDIHIEPYKRVKIMHR